MAAILLKAKSIHIDQDYAREKSLDNVDIVVDTDNGLVFVPSNGGADSVAIPVKSIKRIEVGASIAQIAAELAATDLSYT